MMVQWYVPRGSVRAISTALNDLMVATRAEHGCRGCFLATQMGSRAGFTYREEWESEEDLVAQLRSGRFSKLAQLLENAIETPDVEFALPGGTRGIDYANEVRIRSEEPQ